MCSEIVSNAGQVEGSIERASLCARVDMSCLLLDSWAAQEGAGLEKMLQERHACGGSSERVSRIKHRLKCGGTKCIHSRFPWLLEKHVSKGARISEMRAEPARRISSSTTRLPPERPQRPSKRPPPARLSGVAQICD